MDVDRLRVAEELPAALGSVRRALRRSLEGGPLFGPLTGAQAELLRLVRRQSGVSVAKAAAELRLAANTVSTLVGQLSRAGLLVRAPDPGDRRIVRLRLTELAQRQVQRRQADQQRILAEALAHLSPAQVTALAAAVPALSALVEALAAQSTPVGGGTAAGETLAASGAATAPGAARGTRAARRDGPPIDPP
jgi:DNA-binding MarR family transcriptional regulator